MQSNDVLIFDAETTINNDDNENTNYRSLLSPWFQTYSRN